MLKRDFQLEDEVAEVELLHDNDAQIVHLDIQEKLAQRHQEKYEDAFKNLFEQLEEFGRELRNNLKTVSCIFHHNLNKSNERIKALSSVISRMITVQKEEILIEVWDNIQFEFSQQFSHIKSFCLALKEQEEMRMSMVYNLLKETYDKLISSGHSTVRKIQRELFLIAMKVDQASLMNRKYLINLSSCLYTLFYQKENEKYFQWRLVWQFWWEKTEKAMMEQLNFSIKSVLVDDKFANEDRIKKFLVEKDHFITYRINSLYTLRKLKPPDCNNESVSLWYHKLLQLSKNHEQLIESLKSLSTNGKINLLNNFADIINDIKSSVIARNICTLASAETFLQNVDKMLDECEFHLLSVIDNVKKTCEAEKDGLDALEAFMHTLLEKVVSLWKTHQLQLGKLAHKIQCKLDQELKKYQIICEEKELILSTVLDELVNECECEKMKNVVSKAEKLLEEIHQIQITLNKSQKEIVNCYPHEVKQQLEEYRKNLKECFDSEMANSLLDVSGSEKSESDTKVEAQTKDNVEPMSWDLTRLVLMPHPSGTYSATSFREKYSIRKYSCDLNELNSNGSSWLGCEPKLRHLQKIICINFSVHLNEWVIERFQTINNIRDAKLLELHNEMKVKHKLHSSRMNSVLRLFKGRVLSLESLCKKMNSSIKQMNEELNQIKTLSENVRKKFQDIFQKLEFQVKISVEEEIPLKFRNGRLDKKMLDIFSYLDENLDLISTDAENTLKLIQEHCVNIRNIHREREKDSKNNYFKTTEGQKLLGTFNKPLNSLANIEAEISIEIKEWQTKLQQDMIAWKILIENTCKAVAEENQFLKKINGMFTNMQMKIKIEVKGCSFEGMNFMNEIRELEITLDRMLESSENKSLEDIMELLNCFKKISATVIDQIISLGLMKQKDNVEIGDIIDKTKTSVPQKDKKIISSVSDSKVNIPNEMFGIPVETDSLLEKKARTLLMENYKEMMNIAEIFYIKRTVHFPNKISPTLEEFKSQSDLKFKSIWKQCQVYLEEIISDTVKHKKSFDHLTKKLTHAIPQLVFSNYIVHLRQLKDFVVNEFCSFNEYWKKIRNCFLLRLKPSLGKPTSRNELLHYIKEVNNSIDAENLELSVICHDVQTELQILGEKFISDLNYITQLLLNELDDVLHNKDITIEVSENGAIVGLEEDNLLEMPHEDHINLDENSLSSNKHTFMHELALRSRLNTYRHYLKYSSEILKMISENEVKYCQQVDAWKRNWMKSCHNLQEALLPY